MKVINISRNIVLADNCRIAAGVLGRIRGLLGKSSLGKSEALLLRPCNSVHSFFMHFAIDLLFIDRDSRVVKVIRELKPFRISPVYFKAYCVVEFPPATLNPDSVQPGDTISIE